MKQALQTRANGASCRQIYKATQVMGSYRSYVPMSRNKTYLGIRKCGHPEVEDAHGL